MREPNSQRISNAPPTRRRRGPPDQEPAVENDTGRRLRAHRLQAHLSMRELARRAGVAVSHLSNLEAGRVSPSLASLRKVLVALGTDLEPFFANGPTTPAGCVFRRQEMRRVMDPSRSYTFVLPPRPDIGLIMFDEELLAGHDHPEFETLAGDLAGYVLTGELRLEIQGDVVQTLEPGEAFFVPAGTPVRGWCGDGAASTRLITVETQDVKRSAPAGVAAREPRRPGRARSK
jgi:transcriptional regulator with XRE-family HTH domain